MTEPRSRPILMSAPMIRALLDGRKTQTRRVVKLPHHNPLGQWKPSALGGPGVKLKDGTPVPVRGCIWHTRTGDCLSCPHGGPGDELWVKEALFRNREPDEKDDEGRPIFFCRYTATPDMLCGFWSPLMILGGFHHQPRGYTVSPIHMPRAYSRITLRITDVRVERLCDISEADAIAEGIFNGEYDPGLADGGKPGWCWKENHFAGTPQHAYELLWESIHGPGSWAANPFVWVIGFERVTDKVRAAA